LRALAGLETGILGGLLTAAWFALSSFWTPYHVWMTANYFAMPFYGESALRMGFSHVTLSGLALQLVLAGLAGAFFGVAAPHSHTRLALFALMFSFGIYLASYNLVWRRWNPASALLGHMLFGCWLTRFPAFYSKLHPVPAAPPPEL
jgi:hypothetical protein